MLDYLTQRRGGAEGVSGSGGIAPRDKNLCDSASLRETNIPYIYDLANPANEDRYLAKWLDAHRLSPEARAVMNAARALYREFYAEIGGDRLPQMRELAAHFGVSIRVVVRAFAKLETERLVSGRRGVGCVVLKPPTSFWKGQIVVIVPGGDYVYCQNIRAGVVCDRLSVRGYLMQRVTVPAFKRRVYDFRSLDLLLRQDTSLVVMVGSQPEIERHLAVSKRLATVQSMILKSMVTAAR